MVPGFWDANPKAMFFSGLFLGVAVASSLGFGVILGSLWTGKPVGGQVAVAAGTGEVPTNPGAVEEQQPAPPANPVQPFDEKNDHLLGNKNAKVTLISYSDFQCPYCRRFIPTIQETLKKYPKDVRVVFRHFPLSSIHPFAQKAAEASECVTKLGGNDAFWKMHDKLFAASEKGDLTNDVLLTLAKEVGVDQNKVKECLDKDEMKARVEAFFASGNDSGVEGTPATFVNGKLVSGALPFSMFEAELKAAGAKE